VNFDSEIKKLFKTRDEAVLKQDKDLFLSTQLAEVDYASGEGYLAIDRLKSEVLYIHSENDLEKAVFVKEIYSPKRKKPYSSFVVYFLVNTKAGLRIYKIR